LRYTLNETVKLFSSSTIFIIGAIFQLMESDCFGKEILFGGTQFRVVSTEPAFVRSCWKNERGEILHSLKAAKAHLEKAGDKVQLLTNGGIFEPGCIPSGLYVEEGKVMNPLNLKKGKGNFFLKPNGVFYIEKESDKAGVIESSKATPENYRLAVQSGPMLLNNGKVHPAFNKNSKSKLLRNGVGVDKNGNVIFVITAKGEFCNLWTFAKLFEKLGCREALFLDGDLSRMVENPKDEVSGQGFATIFAIVSGPDFFE